MKHRKLTVNQKHDGKTLQDYLALILDISRNRAKALIDSRSVFVERRPVWMAKHVLIAGDTIDLPEDLDTKQPAPSKLYILFADSNFIIVDKPAGMISNGAKSVESLLKTQLETEKVMAVHRLDKDTTGCMLFAKSKEAFDSMVVLFKERDVKKRYEAIVYGRIHDQARRINSPIEGLSADTFIEKIDANESATHLKVLIDTGRTHQIRLHMVAIRHPILGDREYGLKQLNDPRAMTIPRQMLHSVSLSFKSPIDDKIIKVRAPLPADFRKCLTMYGLR